MIDLQRAAAVAERAAREAGEILLAQFGRIRRADVATKSAARDLVTASDVASERHIVGLLREHFPEHALEAEEEVHERGGLGLAWIVDPLDGTVNFVHELPFFCVSIALYRGATPLVGVVHAPRLAETFCAVRGGGATLNGEPLRVSTTGNLGDAVLGTGFPYRRNELEHDNLANFGRFFHDVRDLRRLGSAALDLAYTAAGRLDGFWELHLAPHDVAAGALLVLEAGGVVTDADGGADWLRGGHLVAASPALHGQICARVRH